MPQEKDHCESQIHRLTTSSIFLIAFLLCGDRQGDKLQFLHWMITFCWNVYTVVICKISYISSCHLACYFTGLIAKAISATDLARISFQGILVICSVLTNPSTLDHTANAHVQVHYIQCSSTNWYTAPLDPACIFNDKIWNLRHLCHLFCVICCLIRL